MGLHGWGRWDKPQVGLMARAGTRLGWGCIWGKLMLGLVLDDGAAAEHCCLGPARGCPAEEVSGAGGVRAPGCRSLMCRGSWWVGVSRAAQHNWGALGPGETAPGLGRVVCWGSGG